MPSAVCIGESMAVLTPGSAGVSLSSAQWLRLGIGGAESNVAMGLSAMGIDAHWISRVGNDGFGTRILEDLQAHGVGTSGVSVDSLRATGLYVKTPSTTAEGASDVLYYRQGSAATAMSEEMLTAPAVEGLLQAASLVHLSGITPALSHGCSGLCRRILNNSRAGKIISFDVNWRKALWEDQDPAVLAEMANLADIVLVGQDEAREAYGTDDEQELRALLPDPAVLVIKNADVSAIALLRDGRRYEVEALTVEVVEPVGAGDAFAAGYLGGILQGLSQQKCLRLGHISAACTLTVHGDRGWLPSDSAVSSILNVDEQEWTKLVFADWQFASSTLEEYQV